MTVACNSSGFTHSTHRLFTLLVCAVSLISLSERCYAEEGAQAPDFPLQVEVRTIRAEGILPAATEAVPVPSADVEKSIVDLSSQLEHLKYGKFRLVDEQSLVIPPRKRRKLALADGHQITIRPVAVSGESICLWLKWRDRAGTQILDTRVRFVAGQSMLTGTEHTPEVGLILAIKVVPVVVP